MANAKKKQTKSKVNPFKVQQSKIKSKRDKESLDPDDETIKAAIDDFVFAAEKESEGKADKVTPKDTVESSYARMTFAERFCQGNEDSFYIKGNDKQVIFIHSDKSDITTEEEISDITDKWGKGAADLFEEDYSSIKLNGDYLKENWDQLIPKLTEALGDDFGELFSDYKYKGVKNIARKACEFVDKDPTKFEELMRDCKIRSFIRK